MHLIFFFNNQLHVFKHDLKLFFYKYLDALALKMLLQDLKGHVDLDIVKVKEETLFYN